MTTDLYEKGGDDAYKDAEELKKLIIDWCDKKSGYRETSEEEKGYKISILQAVEDAMNEGFEYIQKELA